MLVVHGRRKNLQRTEVEEGESSKTEVKRKKMNTWWAKRVVFLNY